MKTRLFSAFFLAGMILAVGLMASEDEPLRLDLSMEDIVGVKFVDKTIHLKLSSPATLKLKDLTAKNHGKKLIVSYMNNVIVAATIQATIESGNVSTSHPSDVILKEMKKLQNKLSKQE